MLKTCKSFRGESVGRPRRGERLARRSSPVAESMVSPSPPGQRQVTAGSAGRRAHLHTPLGVCALPSCAAQPIQRYLVCLASARSVDGFGVQCVASAAISPHQPAGRPSRFVPTYILYVSATCMLCMCTYVVCGDLSPDDKCLATATFMQYTIKRASECRLDGQGGTDSGRWKVEVQTCPWIPKTDPGI